MQKIKMYNLRNNVLQHATTILLLVFIYIVTIIIIECYVKCVFDCVIL